MTESAVPGPEDYDGHRAQLVSILDRQRLLLEGLIHALHQGDPYWSAEQKEVADTTALMVQGIGVSAHSITRLASEIGMGFRDCLGIARSICEASLNVAYIAAAGSEACERAKRHALQKSFRDLHRETSMGGFRVKTVRTSDPPDPSGYPELEEALAEFTRKGGREITDWTPHNLSQRIDIIREKFGDVAMTFAVSVVSIYRHSSELLHGTYFGSYFFWTAGEDGAPRSRADLEYRLVASHLVSVISASWMSIHGMTSVLCRALNLASLAQIDARLFDETAKYIGGPLQAIRPPSGASDPPAKPAA